MSIYIVNQGVSITPIGHNDTPQCRGDKMGVTIRLNFVNISSQNWPHLLPLSEVLPTQDLLFPTLVLLLPSVLFVIGMLTYFLRKLSQTLPTVQTTKNIGKGRFSLLCCRYESCLYTKILRRRTRKNNLTMIQYEVQIALLHIR